MEKHRNWSVPVRSLLFTLQQAGFNIDRVFDGGECSIMRYVHNRDARSDATEIITSVDESTLVVTKDSCTVTMRLILGNEPDGIVADYGCSSTTIERYFEKILGIYCNRWEGKKCPSVEE